MKLVKSIRFNDQVRLRPGGRTDSSAIAKDGFLEIEEQANFVIVRDLKVGSTMKIPMSRVSDIEPFDPPAPAPAASGKK